MATDFSDMPVIQWPISKLVPYEKNNKKHPEAHVKALAESITEFGLEHPIAVEEDGTIISGHGRRLALLQLGKQFATVRVFVGITKEQAQKLRIAANKTTSNDYDTDALASELKLILEGGLTLDGMGFSEKELTTLMDDIGEIDLGTMSDDIVGDVATHEAGIKDAAAKADEAQVPVSKAFGFKTVTSEQARVITRFLGVSEETYKTSPVEAMVSQMQRVVDAA